MGLSGWSNLIALGAREFDGDLPHEVGGGANSVFAWTIAKPTEQFSNPFVHTRRITLVPHGQQVGGLEVVAGCKARVATYYDRASDCRCYLWGLTAHPRRSGRRLFEWCIELVRTVRWGDFTELLGPFVLLIDDPARKQVFWISDPLGIQPWFIGSHNEQFVGGSSVWPIRQAGLCGDAINFDSLSSWLHCGYDCTGGSLFAGYRRLKPRTATIIRDRELCEQEYAALQSDDRRPPIEEVADQVYERVSSAFDALIAQRGRVAIGLTGGFDSRLLAALCARHRDLETTAAVVCTRHAEAKVAQTVADALGLRLHQIVADGSAWNLYRQPYHFLADGFPITKQVSDVVARRWPGVPLLNGYLGDTLIRGTGNLIDWQAMDALPDDKAAQRQFQLRMLSGNRLDLLDDHTQANIAARAHEAMRSLVNEGRAIGKPALYVALAGRQRFYTSNNFLQHLDISPAIIPFATWELLNYRFQHHYDCFSWETYRAIFRKYAPALAEIPHDSWSGIDGHLPRRASHGGRRWGATGLAAIATGQLAPILVRRKVFPRLAAAAMGHGDVEPAARFVQRLQLLDRRASLAGLQIDWRQI